MLCHSLFAPSTTEEKTAGLQNLLQEADYFVLKSKTLDWVSKQNDEKLKDQWQRFCQHLDLLKIPKLEKWMLLETAWFCFYNARLTNPIESGELAQFIVLATYVKSTFGIRMFQCIFSADVSLSEKRINHYLTACQLLLDLQDRPDLFKIVKETLPKLTLLVDRLLEIHAQYLQSKFPERNIDEVIGRFGQRDDLVQFPLSSLELNTIRSEYLEIKKYLKLINTLSMSELKEKAKKCGKEWREQGNLSAKHELIAIILKCMHRLYKISPYDTQILSFLGIINTPEKLKGRIAQIKTGEGKSTIIAMLAGFMGCQGYFVDIVTSSGYLAVRDGEKYTPFMEALGLTASPICDHHPKQYHFRGQVLYGTNTDFEFAMLRDGLNHAELRYSMRDGKLQPRTFDVVIIDEVDNLFLDTALNSALLSIPGKEDIAWIYNYILEFIKTTSNQESVSKEQIDDLRVFLLKQGNEKDRDKIKSINEECLKKWLKSAEQALNKKREGRDYLLKPMRQHARKDDEEVNKICIVDYANTGRLNEGSQWRNGVHQFLQAKHGLKITPESLTAASLAHPTYFNLYQHIFGLTGTMGEAVEREEIQKIYNVDSFDVPPHFPSKREKLFDDTATTKEEHQEKMFKSIQEYQKGGRPVLVLLESIDDSESFSKFLVAKGMKHQLINENQRESEDYLIAKAGEPSIITVATNTAGRGTDVLLAPESKEAGGLHVIFGFYPRNLRVEGQGFGRAGRQGQPGSCCMILNIDDESIQSFLKFHSLVINYSQLWTAETLISHLNKERTESIKQESNHRYLSSQEEALYFEKLQDFFLRMNHLHLAFQDKNCIEAMLKVCEAAHLHQELVTVPVMEGEKWLQVNESANLLLINQHAGIKMDWLGFVEQFKSAYISSMRYEWALFYNKLHDDDNSEEMTGKKSKLEEAYGKWQERVGKFLSDPKKNIIDYLKYILYSENQRALNKMKDRHFGISKVTP